MSKEKEGIQSAELIIACVILLAAIGVTCFLALVSGVHYLIYLLPIIAFFVWTKIISQSGAPDWLFDISSTLFLLMCGYSSFEVLMSLLNGQASFGAIMLSSIGMGAGVFACCMCFYFSYKCKSAIGHAVSAILCFVFVGILAYLGTLAGWSIWVQVPLLLIIAVGLYYANSVPNCGIAFWMLLAHFILCFVAFLYAVFLDSGAYVGECVTIGIVIAPCSFLLWMYTRPVADVSEDDPQRTLKVLGARLLSLICLVVTLAPFVVMFL